MGPSKDLTGQQFGFLTARFPIGRTVVGSRVVWICECVCGALVPKDSYSLHKKSHHKSCGCKKAETQGKRKDLTGKQFGYLRAIEPVGRTPQGRIIWRLECKCGRTIERTPRDLVNEAGPRSCGCKRAEANRLRGEENKLILDGSRFGCLVVEREIEHARNGSRQFLCRCDCGRETKATYNNLDSGNKTTCGTLCEPALERRRERARIFYQRKRKIIKKLQDKPPKPDPFRFP
jgi:hypothetical protein